MVQLKKKKKTSFCLKKNEIWTRYSVLFNVKQDGNIENVEECSMYKDEKMKYGDKKHFFFFILIFNLFFFYAQTFYYYDDIKSVRLFAFFKCRPLNDQVKWLVNGLKEKKNIQVDNRLQKEESEMKISYPFPEKRR